MSRTTGDSFPLPLWGLLTIWICFYVSHVTSDCSAHGNHPLTPHAWWSNNSTADAAQANYSCFEGFSFNGSASPWVLISCSSGSWTPDPYASYQCAGQPCTGNLTAVNGVITGKTGAVAGSQAEINCEAGYVFNDSSIRKSSVCGGDLNWSPDHFTCEAVQCPPIYNETFSNASTHDHHFGITVNYTCWPDYYFPDGALWRTMDCDQYGRWTEVIPACQDEIVSNVVQSIKITEEAKDGLSFATIAMIVIGVVLLAVVILDAATLGRQLLYMKNNLESRWPNMCKSKTQEMGSETSLDQFSSSLIPKSTVSLGRGKVTPAPSTVDLNEMSTPPPSYEAQDPMQTQTRRLTSTTDIEVINELDPSDSMVSEPPPPPASASKSANRTRLGSARTSIQKALQMVRAGVKATRAMNKPDFSSTTLPLGADNFGKETGERRAPSPVKEEYDSEPSEYETDSEEEEETSA